VMSGVTNTYDKRVMKNSLLMHRVHSFCCDILRLFNRNFSNDYDRLCLEL